MGGLIPRHIWGMKQSCSIKESLPNLYVIGCSKLIFHFYFIFQKIWSLLNKMLNNKMHASGDRFTSV